VTHLSDFVIDAEVNLSLAELSRATSPRRWSMKAIRHTMCLYSQATHRNINVTTTLVQRTVTARRVDHPKLHEPEPFVSTAVALSALPQ
jgi:hypothetical protein